MALPGLGLSTRSPLHPDTEADAVAVAVRRGEDGPEPTRRAREVAAELGLDLPALLARQKAKGEPGEVVPLPVVDAASPTAVLLCVGTGAGEPADLRRAGAGLARASKGRTRLAAAVADDVSAEGLRAFVEGLGLAAYVFGRRSRPQQPGPVENVALVVRDAAAARDAFDRAVATGEAVHTARDLANTPSAEKSPQWLAEQAESLASRAGLAVRVRDEQALAAEGFGGLVAVGQGSSRPPRLVELSYLPDGAGPATPHVVLVGKGVTFDTGGLSLKPRDAMVAMKTDMAGGAAVVAAMGALRALDVRVRVTGLVAAAENMPSGSAYRPGDVLTQYGGRTVEVRNTDAEGRLVLADALAYADAVLDPDVLVDVATLTGAATLALGRTHGALYATDDALADALVAAGEASGERLWRMPLVEDYRSALDSDIADLCHVATDRHVSGGSITAALFLREFVGARRWAHLDIAGPARSSSEEQETTKGGTGFGARVLGRWLESAG